MASESETMRAEFEEFARKRWGNAPWTTRRKLDGYISESTDQGWAVWQAAWSRAPSAEAKDALPFDDEVSWILGRPNFACIHLAQCLRLGGMEIAKKAEAEQGAVLHWMLNLYLAHGKDWRNVGETRLQEIRAAAEQEKAG